MDTSIRGIGEASLYVDDVTDAEQWYNTVLDLETVRRGDHYCFLDTGASSDARQRVLLFDPAETCDQENTPPHGATGPGHIALDIPYSAVDHWRDALDNYDVPIEAEQEWPSGDHSLYFRDPYDNSIELWGRQRLDEDEWSVTVAERLREMQEAVTGMFQ